MIPSFFFDENDDSIELDFISKFFYVDNEDVDSLTGMRSQPEEVSTPEMIDFSELNQLKIDEVYGSALDFHSNKFEITFENSEYLKELFHHSKLLFLDCFSLHLVDARSLFDRGKSVLISSVTYEKLRLQLFLNVGSELNVWEIRDNSKVSYNLIVDQSLSYLGFCS